MKPLRTFIALEVPVEVKDIACNLQDDLRKFQCRVSWTRQQALHLTLKFLGDTYPEQVDEISDAVADITGKYTPFELQLEKGGCFGGRIPRVLWLGIRENEKLTELQKEIDRALSKLGFPAENRKFHPHLTLGRVKDRQGTEEMGRHLREVSVEKCSFTATELIFFKSELKSTGAVYTPLKIFNFQK